VGSSGISRLAGAPGRGVPGVRGWKGLVSALNRRPVLKKPRYNPVARSAFSPGSRTCNERACLYSSGQAVDVASRFGVLFREAGTIHPPHRCLENARNVRVLGPAVSRLLRFINSAHNGGRQSGRHYYANIAVVGVKSPTHTTCTKQVFSGVAGETSQSAETSGLSGCRSV